MRSGSGQRARDGVLGWSGTTAGMSLRITGGEARGREIRALHGSTTRPTAAKAREALFNILRAQIPDKRWLDLYAGNGTIGIEALSRGAAFVDFAEQNPTAVRLIKANLKALGYQERARVWPGRVGKLLAQAPAAPVDVAFLDPPWDQVDYPSVLLALIDGGHLRSDGTIVAEHRKGHALPAELSGWQLQRQVTYGDSAFSFYRQAEGPDPNQSGDG